jgi:hypothetical protein
MLLRPIASFACSILLATSAIAQMGGMKMDKPGAAPSPDAAATVALSGKTLTIKYSAPSIRGRKIMGGLVPYGEVWRTGANPATTLVTPVSLKVGTLSVPAGTYTLFTLPSDSQPWMFIVSKKTGEWGIPYPEGNDLGRAPMKGGTLPASQEVMSISFENTHGSSTELHVRWDKSDQSIAITAQ